MKTDAITIAGIVRNYRRGEDGRVHTGIEVTDVLSIEDAIPGSTPFIEKIRLSVGDLIPGKLRRVRP